MRNACQAGNTCTIMRRHLRPASVAVLLLAVTAGAKAQNWPGWRGPSGTGHTAEKNLPLRWDAQTRKGVLWKVTTGGVGYSSPIIWGKTVFVTTSDKQAGNDVPDHHVVAFAVGDGRRLWRTRIKPGKSPCQFNEYATPTPVTDGKTVYVWFGSGVLAAVDFKGKLLWRQERGGQADKNNSPCSSPVLAGEAVILLCDDADDNGSLQALDKKTGKVRWQDKRAREGGNMSSPIVIDVNGKAQVVVAGAERLEGIDPGNGKPIWWCDLPCVAVPSPVFQGGLVFAVAGDGRGVAVAPDGTGDVTASHVRASCKGIKVGFTSPTIAAGHVYLVQGKGLDCWNLKTGKLAYSETLKGASQYASPIVTADGLLYFASAGQTAILLAGPKFKLVATNTLDSEDPKHGASPAVSNGKLFFRDFAHLYCVGKK